MCRRAIGALLLLWAMLPASLAAQSPQRAGLVIVHGDGTVLTRCVEFTEESISGVELLTRSGLALRLDATGVGTAVCSIGGEGCPAPSSCFCQCQSSPCVYWSYWQLEDGGWRYSNLGAGLTQVGNGVVEGWVWGEGSASGEATAPPALTLDDICTDEVRGDAIPVTQAAQTPAAPDAADSLARATAPSGMPVTMLLVTGAPVLLLVSIWWWVRRRRNI